MSVGGDITLRLGRWQDVLADVEAVDCLLTDPPYGERTHAKQFHGRRRAHTTRGCAGDMKWISTRGLNYAHWTADDVSEFVRFWSPRTRGWMCVFTSHDLIAAYEDALREAGRYVFTPISCVLEGMNVRLAGDGPSNWSTYIVRAKHRNPLADHLLVSRPRSLHKWGTLPGAYVGSPGRGSERGSTVVPGSKPLWLMSALVLDYSRPGDLICDPCAGGATTLLAAALEGRRAIGAEMDPETFEKAQLRIAHGNSALRSPNQTRMEF